MARGVALAYAAPLGSLTPLARAWANLLNEKFGFGHGDALDPLLAHQYPNVAFTAARALAVVGDRPQAEAFERALASLERSLASGSTDEDKKLLAAAAEVMRPPLEEL